MLEVFEMYVMLCLCYLAPALMVWLYADMSYGRLTASAKLARPSGQVHDSSIHCVVIRIGVTPASSACS